MITGELSSHVLWADLLTERRSLGNRIQQQPNDHKVHNECRWTHGMFSQNNVFLSVIHYLP